MGSTFGCLLGLTGAPVTGGGPGLSANLGLPNLGPSVGIILGSFEFGIGINFDLPFGLLEISKIFVWPSNFPLFVGGETTNVAVIGLAACKNMSEFVRTCLDMIRKISRLQLQDLSGLAQTCLDSLLDKSSKSRLI